MLIFLFFFTIYFISIIGLGFQTKKLLSPLNITSIGEAGILGLFTISFIITFFHLFFPISDFFNVLILLFGMIFFLTNYKAIKLNFKIEKSSIIILIFLSIFLFFNHKPNEDFGFYHLPYVVNLKSEKIIFGLSNLQINQGWNSMWLNLHSFFSFKYNGYKTIYIVNILFYLFINLVFLKKIFYLNISKEKSELLTKYFSIAFFCFFNIKFARLNSFGIDVPSNFLLILSILYFFKTLHSHENRISNLKFLSIFIVFAFMSRISNALFLLLPIYLIFRLGLFSTIVKSKFFIFMILFLLVWIIQQFVYTGCFIFPYKFFCYSEASWYDSDFLENFKVSTTYANKSFSSYTGDMSYENYHNKLNWVSTWFLRTKIEIMEYLIAFLIPFLFLIFKKKMKIKNLFNLFFFNQPTLILIILIFFSALLWFLNSPVIRMGNHFIFLLLFLLLFILLNYFGQLRFSSKKNIYILIFFVFVFHLSKNIVRVNGDFSKKTFFPEFQNIDFETIKILNKKIHINMVREGNTIQSRVCWDVPFLCTTDDDFDVKIKNSYVFIKKN